MKMTTPKFAPSNQRMLVLVLMLCGLWAGARAGYAQTGEVTRGAATEPTLARLIDLGRLGEAREKLREQMAKDGTQPRLLLFEAMILYREQQYVESLRTLEQSLRLYDGDADVYKLAGLNLVAVGKEDVAAEYFARAIALAPQDFMARYYLGLHYLTSKQLAQAAASAQAVIQLNPKYVDAYLVLGVAQEQLGQEAAAIQTYQQAIEITEQQPLKTEKPSLYLARLLLSLQRYEQSLPPLQKAVALNPQSAEAQTLLGRVLSNLKRYDEAIQALQEAARLAPQDKSPHYLLMGIYQKLGNTSAAQREMQLFRALEANEKKQ
jgi:tetratricopeptide (TPR) repeat protein